MSTKKLNRVIEKEIEKLNEEIDLKIIRGQSYKKEARRHKFLISQLKQIKTLSRKAEVVSARTTFRSFEWLSRPFARLSFVSTFLF